MHCIRRPFGLPIIDMSIIDRSYGSSVIASIIQLPQWIANLGYEDGVIPE